MGSYLYRKWFSIDAPMSYSCASWTGLLNRVNLQWDTVWLDALELPIERFPHLADYHDVLVGLSSVYASRWPKLANVPFYLAIGDGAAANVGVGALDEQAIAITIGTTSAARMITSRLPDVSNGLWSYRLDKHHHLLGGALSAGGNIYKWLQSVLRLPEDADALVLAQRNKSHGLSFVPSLAGERSLRWNPFITGQIQGLRLETTAIDILQAALEGVALQLAAVIEQMPSTSSTKIYASGGALSASIAWPAIITDILGKEIYLIDFVETTARGCACLVLSHFGKRVLTEFERLPTKIVTPSS
ncbi:MAG: hypothetical protein CUN55_16050 [Phototrophicales bacterium]|nr:MAG: hypothetical protein CUN55_16050 [Phototrophicales bacterium]